MRYTTNQTFYVEGIPGWPLMLHDAIKVELRDGTVPAHIPRWLVVAIDRVTQHLVLEPLPAFAEPEQTPLINRSWWVNGGCLWDVALGA